MTQLLLIVIFISAALSLLSYIFCWQDIKGGHPHIISLRQITCIMDRTKLDAWFGAHKPGYYYALTPQQIQGIVRRRRWFMMCECALDGLCVLGAWWFASGMGQGISVSAFIILAGLCQVLSLLYSFFLMRKWHHQIQEELENLDE